MKQRGGWNKVLEEKKAGEKKVCGQFGLAVLVESIEQHYATTEGHGRHQDGEGMEGEGGVE